MIENIDIRKLVDEIHSAENAKKEDKWREWCEENGHCRRTPDGRAYLHAAYSRYVTDLYTLRAWCRGRLHRKNPTDPVRQYAEYKGAPPEEIFFSKSYFYPYDFEGKWDVREYNKCIAEKVAGRFRMTQTPSLTWPQTDSSSQAS